MWETNRQTKSDREGRKKEERMEKKTEREMKMR